MNVQTLRAYSLKGSDFDRTQREANVEHTHPRRPPFSLLIRYAYGYIRHNISYGASQ